MPELPEVEVTLRGLAPQLCQQIISKVVVRNYQLRWPIPKEIANKLKGQKILEITRRGKYLIFHLSKGNLIVHLGMSGSLRLYKHHVELQKHDHIDVVFENGTLLRLHDPRRFGAFLWWDKDIASHPLLKDLGIEPLDRSFNGSYLFDQSINRKKAVKLFIMDQQVVVGVGNIYANEALFLAKIHPKIAANKITKEQYQNLATAIKQVLKKAINKGGTTLRNFISSDGKLGYFVQTLNVYGRGGKACYRCGNILKEIRLGQRSTVFCEHCQIYE